MSDDISEMMKKMSEMLKNNEIPDNVKSIISNLSSKSSEANTSSENGNSFNKNSTSENSNSDFPDIDLNTMLKMKSIIDSMNKQQNDPRANLLRSLKPYLKPSRKEKVEQYIKLFSMGKVFETLNPLGGENKNDV